MSGTTSSQRWETGPIDFVAARIPAEAIADPDLKTNEDPIWLSGPFGKQALLLSRDEGGTQSYRYLPVSGLNEDADGKITFVRKEWDSGYPLKIFEDENFAVLPRNAPHG
jgi:hypothetical protein